MFVAAADHSNIHGAFDPDGRVVGFTYSMRDSELAYLHMIGVDPDYWNEGVAADLIQANQAYWKAQGVTALTLTFDPLKGANANLFLKDRYDNPGWICVFSPDYYPDEENAHRFHVEFPFESSRPERMRHTSTGPEATLLAVSDNGAVDTAKSLASYDSDSGRWNLPSDLPSIVEVEFPWDASRLSENQYVPDGPWRDIQSQWLDAIEDICSNLLSTTNGSSTEGSSYFIFDINPYCGDAPYDSAKCGAANSYILVKQTEISA